MKNVDYINFQIIHIKNNGENIKEISDGDNTFEDLYKQRMIFFSFLCNSNPELSWKSKSNYDEENDSILEDTFVAGINTPQGPITYHFKLENWDEFKIKEIQNAPQVDDTKDVLSKVKSLI